mmetsp:Transcript_22898/g.54113  ORF Transcript_22898/g.54113 Transcript_22898/m.54113 type:complete len:125 (+) Transcript_22898:81-455(+)
MKAYGAACAVSCGTAVSLNEALKRATPRLSANALFALGKIIPYSAVVSASIFNVYLMRRQETIKGIEVADENGRVLGTSRKAGAFCVFVCNTDARKICSHADCSHPCRFAHPCHLVSGLRDRRL